MKFFRAEIHGRLIEVRIGDWEGEYVFIDGREVSRRLLAGWMPSGWHGFDLVDEKGRSRRVEARLEHASLGLGPPRAVICVDGVERCRIEPLGRNAPPHSCVNCGYLLRALPVVNGEVRCPECGRHSSAKLLGDDAPA